MKQNKLYWRINENIRAPQIRVIDEKGKQIGILSREEAIKKARNKGLTLVEIAHKANPPVTKIVEFGKFRYQEEKKLRSQLKKSKVSEVKEIHFSPFIAENDYNTRLERVKEFLADRDKVRVVVVFRRPQMRSKDFGYKLLDRILAELDETVTVDMEPKFLGRNLMMIISPRSSRKTSE